MTLTHAQSIAALTAALGPLNGVPAATVEVYLSALEDLDAGELQAAVVHLIETQEERWLPTVATIRRLVFERRLGLPSPEQAWEQIQTREGRRAAPEAVRSALSAVGGSWALRTADSPEWFRKAFLEQYADARRRAIETGSADSRAALHATAARKLTT